MKRWKRLYTTLKEKKMHGQTPKHSNGVKRMSQSRESHRRLTHGNSARYDACRSCTKIKLNSGSRVSDEDFLSMINIVAIKPHVSPPRKHSQSMPTPQSLRLADTQRSAHPSSSPVRSRVNRSSPGSSINRRTTDIFEFNSSDDDVPLQRTVNRHSPPTSSLRAINAELPPKRSDKPQSRSPSPSNSPWKSPAPAPPQDTGNSPSVQPAQKDPTAPLRALRARKPEQQMPYTLDLLRHRDQFRK